MTKKAFMFAGQGAQATGMAMELKGIAKVDSLFAEADSIIPGIIDIINGSIEELNKTINTQPAMFIADLAYAFASTEVPSAVCGFSVGEIPALAYAKAFSISDGLRIIRKRAELMEEASQKNSGGMLAVLGLSAEMVENIVDTVDGAWTANYNGHKQTVVAYVTSAYDELCQKVVSSKGKAIKLKVSGAFHCPLLQDGAKELKTFIDTIEYKKPEIPVFANTTAIPYESNISQMLHDQMCGAVRFTDIVANMKTFGIEEFIEVGAGKVLTNLISKL